MNDSIWMIFTLVWGVLALISWRGLLKYGANFKRIPGMLRFITVGVIIMIDGIILVSLLFMISLIVQTGEAIW